MPTRCVVAILAIVSLSACGPRALIATGTMTGLVGGAFVATTHVRNCSSPEASDLCGFDQLGDTIKQDTGVALVITSFVLIVAGLVGLSSEHTRPPRATRAPPSP
jgi:hypothetical protein